MTVAAYREWETSPTKRVVHICMIERGDGSAANRITATDRPYYDKGKAGVKYHQTYPAPLHCLVSEITTDERFDGTTFGDIVLSNAYGEFDDLVTANDTIGQRGRVMRGDPSWSLMETELPYRFETIFEFQVSSVLFEDNGQRVRLAIEPVRWDLGIKVGLERAPRCYGQVMNAQMILLDQATNKYRGSTLDLRDYEANFVLRDSGVPLVHPDNPGADYSLVLYSGLFTGDVELVSSPTGKLTFDCNMDYAFQPIRNINWVMHTDVLENLYDLISQSLDASAIGDVFCMVNGEAVFYVLDSYGTGIGVGLLRRYTLGTPGDLSTFALSGGNKDIYAVTGATFLWGIWVDDDEEFMYAVGGDGGGDKAYLMEFGTPGDQSTLTLQGSKSLAGMASFDPAQIQANPAGDRVWIMFFNGKMMQFDMTQGDITTLTADGVEHDFSQFDNSLNSFHIANSGKNLYITGDAIATTWQLELPTANDITEWVQTRKHYYHASATPYLDPYKIHVSADSMFVMNLSEFINQVDLIGDDFDLPPAVVESAVYSTDQELRAGVQYTTLTEVGTVMADLCTAFGGEFAVDRYGLVRVHQMHPPEDAPAYYPAIDIKSSDFVGLRQTRIVALKNDLPARKVGVTYRRLAVVQDEGELGGGLTQDEVYSFTQPYRIDEVTNTLDAWEESEDFYIEGPIAATSTFEGYLKQRFADLKAVPRQHYELSLALRAVPLLTRWGVGDIINVVDSWNHSDIADGDKLQVTGRSVNWSRETQKVRVFM